VATRASSRNRWTNCVCAVRCGRTFFTTHARATPFDSSIARYTSPIPPTPILRTRRKGPNSMGSWPEAAAPPLWGGVSGKGREGATGCAGEVLERLGVVGQAHEAGLELAGREVDPFLQHGVEEATEATGVRALGARIVGDRALAEEEGPHAADAVEREGHPGGAGLGDHDRLDLRRGRLETRVHVRLAEQRQGGVSRRDGQRIPGERSCLVDGTLGRELIHQLRASTKGTERQP